MNKQQQITSRLLGISLLQYSFLIPLMRFINSSMLVAITSVILFLILLWVNRSFVISFPVFSVGLGVFVIVLFKMVIGHADFSTLYYILLFVFPVLCMFIYPYSLEEMLYCSCKLSKLSFCVLFWIPFFSYFYTSYMRFGYGMLTVVVFTYIDFAYLQKKGENSNVVLVYRINKLISFVILLVGSVEILFFGSRGATFALILFVALDRIFYNKRRVLLNSFCVLLAIVSYIYIDKIFHLIDIILQALGVFSYAVMKFERQLSRGFAAASSSRDTLYMNSIEMIKKSPFWGNPISIDEEGGDYVHNIFLQVAQDLGILMLIVLVCFVLYSIYQIANEKNLKSDRLIILSLFSISIGRLMFSSTIWRRPEFWMLICIIINLKSLNRSNRLISHKVDCNEMRD